mgnify:CR=1 FL=1
MTTDATAAPVDPPGRWSALIVLALAMLCGMTTWFSATAVVPQLRDAWALSAGQAAWLTIAVQVGFVAGALASAVFNVADRIAPRRLMLYGGAIAALANALLLVEPGVAAAIALRAITGFALASVYPPAMKAMATWFKVKRGTALGIMVGALTLGSAAPHLVNGLGGLDWRVVIALTSALTLAGGVIAEYVGSDGPFERLAERYQRIDQRLVAEPGLAERHDIFPGLGDPLCIARGGRLVFIAERHAQFLVQRLSPDLWARQVQQHWDIWGQDHSDQACSSDADCPDASASAATPPSIAAIRSSNTAHVGFMILV